MTLAERMTTWTGQYVVIDCVSPFVVIGQLRSATDHYLELIDADIHDLRDTTTNREMYVVKSARLGVQVNRRSLIFNLRELVGIALLDDVIKE